MLKSNYCSSTGLVCLLQKAGPPKPLRVLCEGWWGREFWISITEALHSQHIHVISSQLCFHCSLSWYSCLMEQLKDFVSFYTPQSTQCDELVNLIFVPFCDHLFNYDRWFSIFSIDKKNPKALNLKFPLKLHLGKWKTKAWYSFKLHSGIKLDSKQHCVNIRSRD